MKYVMLMLNMGGIRRKVPVIFPDIVCHDDMALWFAEVIKASMPVSKVEKVASAGFIDMYVHSTHGKSETLGIGSYENDAKLINVYDYFGGIE